MVAFHHTSGRSPVGNCRRPVFEREIMPEIEVGKKYKVHHCRKGDFVVRIKRIGDVWIDAEIVDGEALYVSSSFPGRGNKVVGEKITMRKSFCTFTEFEN